MEPGLDLVDSFVFFWFGCCFKVEEEGVLGEPLVHPLALCRSFEVHADGRLHAVDPEGLGGCGAGSVSAFSRVLDGDAARISREVSKAVTLGHFRHSTDSGA